jgi:hypothetical protein
MFLKVSTYLHCFDFASVDGAPVDTASEHFGITLVPKEQNIKVTARAPAALAKGFAGAPGVTEH